MINTKRAMTVLWAICLCLAIFFCFVFSNRVHNLEAELKQVNNNIKRDIKDIHVLKAQWSLLNNPSRLRQLAQKHISLNKIKSEQIINYSALPFDYENNNQNKIPTTTNQQDYKKLVKAVR